MQCECGCGKLGRFAGEMRRRLLLLRMHRWASDCANRIAATAPSMQLHPFVRMFVHRCSKEGEGNKKGMGKAKGVNGLATGCSRQRLSEANDSLLLSCPSQLQRNIMRALVAMRYSLLPPPVQRLSPVE